MSNEPIIKNDDGKILTLSEAEAAWETGEFSDWAVFPIRVGDKLFTTWDGLEDELSDLRREIND